MSQTEAKKIQEERRKLMDEVFDLYDRDNLGYVFSKDALKILSAMGRVLEPEDETDFLSMIDPKNEGRITKNNFLAGVEAMYTIPDNYMPEITEAFKTFDKNNDGKILVKDFKNLLINLSGEYKLKDVENLFNILGIDINDESDSNYINIDDFINVWKFQLIKLSWKKKKKFYYIQNHIL